MVWGPLLPSPNSPNPSQGWWTLGEGSELDVNVGDNNAQFCQGAKCPKPSFITTLGPFHHGYALFLSDDVKYRFQTRFVVLCLSGQGTCLPYRSLGFESRRCPFYTFESNFFFEFFSL